MTLKVEMWNTDGTLHDTYVDPNGGGWTSRKEWEKSVRGRMMFDRFDERGRAVFHPTGSEIKLIHIVDVR